MPIDRESGEVKHIITGYEHWVDLGGGRGALCAYTLCGWLYLPARMECAHAVSGWWASPKVNPVCGLCAHMVACRVRCPQECERCREVDRDGERGHPVHRAGGADVSR
ncbi:hypothetical protein [Streptomonospora litoralis]|uniref:Uncharacterized protein n=1 Tax=Streptomonospora litoralis TaxID=2498135 RepID=A0A4P6Q7Q2_9ACTN|nr:hypothetical protein [Streptomonospora litoralis]QBI56828.1 hypothetical protein EKD16_25440 [Streptomonospora litoralis]